MAEILAQHFVEARLHTDQGEAAERNGDLQQELLHNLATPLYLVLDPRTGRKLTEPLGGTTTVKAFSQFLRGALEASKERVGRLDER